MAEKVDDVFAALQRKMREGSLYQPVKNGALGLIRDNRNVKINISCLLTEKQFEIPYSEYRALMAKLEEIQKAYN